MPKPGYTKRHFSDDFKKRAVYEIKTGMKRPKDVVDEHGRAVPKILTDRWAQKYANSTPEAMPSASFQFIPGAIPVGQEDLVREIGRLYLRLSRYESNTLAGGRRKTDLHITSADNSPSLAKREANSL